MRHEDFMREAIRLSMEHMEAGDGGPFGAVVVHKGKIIGKGYNRVTSSNDPTAHAEIVAIRNAAHALNRFDLSDCELYTSCEPCPMCLAATYWARIPVIYFANTREDAAAIDFDDALIYEEIAKPMEQRSLSMKPLLREEALAVFHTWQNKEDKTPY